jgi:Na+/phosphate symporter
LRFVLLKKVIADWVKITSMKKLPNIQLSQLMPYALAIAGVGFCLMQTDDWTNIGAIVFSLGLLPPAVLISRYKD